MEKYEKLFKGLEMCAGPDCNPECPYHGETRGGKTCRAWLLDDAAFALAAEESLADALKSELNDLQQKYTFVIQHRDELAADKNALLEQCKNLRTAKTELDAELHRTQQREATLLNNGAAQGDEKAEYKRGYLDAMEYCFRELCRNAGGGGGRHV